MKKWLASYRLWAAVLVLAGVAIVATPRARHWARHHVHRYLTYWRSGGSQWIEFHEHAPKLHPTAEDKRAGFLLFRRSIMERIYPSSRPQAGEIVNAATLQVAFDQYEPIQIGVYPLRDLRNVKVSVSRLVDAQQHVIPKSEIDVRMERYYGASLSIRVGNRFGVVPKTLEVAVPLDIAKGEVRPYWITVHVPNGQPGGLYQGTIHVADATSERTLPFAVDVLPVQLQEPDILYGALSTNTLANIWKPRRSAEVMRQAEVIFADQRAHGMNTICLRSGRVAPERGGSPFLPDLDAAIEFAQRYHFTKPLIYSAGTLLKTEKINRSSSYRDYDSDLSVSLAQRISETYGRKVRDAGLAGLIFIPVEEPNLKSGIDPRDPPDIRQRMAHELTAALKQTGATTALTCTPESVRCCASDLDYWIVAFKRFSPKLYEMARAAHAHLCLYANATVMGQGTYFSRFMFGYFTWANGLEGMLPWTYPMQPKRFPRNVDGRGEGGLKVVDGFLGIDHKPIPVIQWELSREGIDDVRYLVTIERLAREARASVDASRQAAAEQAEQFLASIKADVKADPQHYLFENKRTFEPAPVDDWNAKKFEATRARAVEILRSLLPAPSEPRR